MNEEQTFSLNALQSKILRFKRCNMREREREREREKIRTFIFGKIADEFLDALFAQCIL
jgi:hypothetical protein